MQLKLISDGTPQNSKLVNAETGELIENVEFVDLRIHATEGVTGTIRFLFLRVDVNFISPPVIG